MRKKIFLGIIALCSLLMISYFSIPTFFTYRDEINLKKLVLQKNPQINQVLSLEKVDSVMYVLIVKMNGKKYRAWTQLYHGDIDYDEMMPLE